MCKIMAVAGIKPEHVPKVQKLAKAASKEMSWVDEDGVGYAAITKSGSIYGQKWRNKEDAFVLNEQPKPSAIATWMKDTFGDMADWPSSASAVKIYDEFGTRNEETVKDTVALILHARKATFNIDKTIENVHPFAVINQKTAPDTALIHNGSILNHDKLTKTMSTCYSEVILHEYLNNMTYYNPWSITEIAKTLVGEYAVGVLSSILYNDDTQEPILDIFKSGKELYAGYVIELQTMVFCTSDTILETACKNSDLTVKNIVKIKEGFLLRLSATTGARIEDIIPFTPSNKYMNTHSAYMPYTRSHVPTPAPSMKEVDDITETIDTISSVKKDFEAKHPTAFSYPYVEVSTIDAKEKELFAELGKGKDINHKALHLVAVALASAKA